MQRRWMFRRVFRSFAAMSHVYEYWWLKLIEIWYLVAMLDSYLRLICLFFTNDRYDWYINIIKYIYIYYYIIIYIYIHSTYIESSFKIWYPFPNHPTHHYGPAFIWGRGHHHWKPPTHPGCCPPLKSSGNVNAPGQLRIQQQPLLLKFFLFVTLFATFAHARPSVIQVFSNKKWMSGKYVIWSWFRFGIS